MRLLIERGDFRKVPNDFELAVFAPCDGAVLSGDSYYVTCRREYLYKDIIKPLKKKGIPLGSVLRVKADEIIPHPMSLVFARLLWYKPFTEKGLEKGLLTLSNKLQGKKVSICIPTGFWYTLPQIVENIWGHMDLDVLLRQ